MLNRYMPDGVSVHYDYLRRGYVFTLNEREEPVWRSTEIGFRDEGLIARYRRPYAVLANVAKRMLADARRV